MTTSARPNALQEALDALGDERAARLSAEEALRVSEERYQLAMAATDDVIWDWELANDYLLASSSFGKIIGEDRLHREGALLRVPMTMWLELVHPEDRAAFHARAAQARLGLLHIWGVEYRLRRWDGGYATVLDRASLVRSETGHAVRAIGTLTDITERKWVQALQEDAQGQAESASRAKGEFLANMSHEIRTPMNGVLGMLELVLDTELSAEQRDYIDTAHSSAESLLSVINDILDLSKIEAGKMTLDKAPFELGESISEIINTFSLRAYAKHIELLLDIGDDVPNSLIGDLGKIRQIVVNLVGNAIKFTARGEVTLRIGADSCEGSSVRLHVSVLDTGPGIPIDKQVSIFQAFEQADASTTRNFGGTGLGLAIAARLATLMSGKIWVTSEQTVGSAFHFTAELERGSMRVETAAPREAMALAGKRVLIVDDNAAARAVLMRIATSSGMIPVATASAKETPGLTNPSETGAEQFDLVLIDADLDGTGFELAGAIRGAKRPTPVIMLLGSAVSGAEALRCRELTIDYVAKPVAKHRLVAVAERVCGGEVAVLPRAVKPRVEPTAHSLRLLVADDNAVNRRLAARLLEKRGHRVTTAQTGRETVEAWRRDAFDAILMDVEMPDMDGLAATRAIREAELIRGGPPIHIVAVTAHATSEDQARCLEAGMSAYLSKPIRSQALFEAVEHLDAAGIPR
jgi:two-component system, sensor histidine kinase and response regulator